MDPVTAVGLASGIVAFITFSTSLVKGAIQIHEALDGSLEENRSHEAIAAEMKRFAIRLLPPDDSRLSGEGEGANKVHENERADLEQRLDYCRSQLDLHLTFPNKTSLDALVEAAKSDAGKLERLRSNVEDLRQGIRVAGISAEAQEQIRRLVEVQEDAFSSIIQSRIAKSLAFEGIHDRFDMVEEAHLKTFRWIFHDSHDSSVDGSSYGSSGGDATGSLLGRASSISGKLGSGKSTLMKYLGDHPRTRAELIKWADLVVAKYFFWRPGSSKQKSLDGLYRSLLHDVLESQLWAKARVASWQVQTEFAISEKDVRTAFARLVRNTSRNAKHCFCFFIDGLDEYQETAQNDHKEMVKLLTGWTTTAPRDVKLCVSSREDNMYMYNFSDNKRLRLHELTRFDMEAYAWERLDDISDQEAKRSLVTAITDRAEGIFLWAALLVKQVRDQLENGADFAALVQVVDLLPDELDGLYEHILKSLSKPDRKKAYQTLAILALSRHWRLPVSLFACSFLDKYNVDKMFAEQDDFAETGLDGMAYEEHIKLSRKRVNGWCRGLVESATGSIGYAHRSIPEFLDNQAIKDEMESFLAGFSAAEALRQLTLA
ncbi:uncharacterized protein B0T15DRAFT_485616 [Chaetomium strumarium]|uniref:NACHT domain-containing protein n=1 Tax=Chaetomium strumarium TaxID=1170767 RepID=A0AAJ0GU98_9PEZI|nr:hypothetical protein B0T15DRAFT_485616 [Chaetomium strumarium]